MRGKPTADKPPLWKVLGAPKVFASCIFSKLVVKKTFKSGVYKS
jgi:hypothetical protein